MDGRSLLNAGVITAAFILVEPISHALFIVGIIMLAIAGIRDVLELLTE